MYTVSDFFHSLSLSEILFILLTPLIVSFLVYSFLCRYKKKLEKNPPQKPPRPPKSAPPPKPQPQSVTVHCTIISKSAPSGRISSYEIILFESINDHTRIPMEVKRIHSSMLLVGDTGTLNYIVHPNGRSSYLLKSPGEFVSFTLDSKENVSVQNPEISTSNAPVPATIVRLSSIDSKVLFELTDGSRVNLVVPPSTFLFLREGMHGQLSYQGDTFQLFTPDAPSASPASPSLPPL